MQIRLQKILSQAGIASRRGSENLIKQGNIKVNGKVIKKLGCKVDPKKDKIEFQGKPISLEKKIYLILNKPAGYLSTVKDSFNRPKVTDLIKDKSIRLYPVGRLDLDTEGLLILTNDGEFTIRVIHPRHHTAKNYIAELDRTLSAEDRKSLERGVILEEGRTLPAKISKLKGKKIKIVLCEGRKRQIKRMLALFDYEVRKLKRIAIGPVKLGNLALGKYRRLKKTEIKALIKC